mmetsp:Transcript_11219/g.69292  ORF Transcript_11219/g.69292 Transcript_11219/m.69292 type:complete len:83 (-) Transcript_11219:2071-2319(-)
MDESSGWSEEVRRDARDRWKERDHGRAHETKRCEHPRGRKREARTRTTENVRKEKTCVQRKPGGSTRTAGREKESNTTSVRG